MTAVETRSLATHKPLLFLIIVLKSPKEIWLLQLNIRFVFIFNFSLKACIFSDNVFPSQDSQISQVEGPFSNFTQKEKGSLNLHLLD